METRPSLIPSMVDNSGDTSSQRIRHTLCLGDTMIIKLYGEKAKEFSKEHNLPRNIKVLASNLPTYKLTSVEGRDIVEIDIT